ncbi:MAG: hypothetical protein JRN19_05705 [Nitrososphaerota archaeon]|nr:hypothetical protein [Nitrososphaerota archaeon]MDG7051929.1 hypothetical protein [Nitrososphaerota archaeon]
MPKVKTILIVALTLMMFLMPTVAITSYAQPSVPASVQFLSPSSVPTATPSSIIPNPPVVQPVSLSDATNEPAPAIPLVTTFVNIPFPSFIYGITNAASSSVLQLWNIVVSNSTFQTLYQAYGANGIGVQSGYTPNSTFFGFTYTTSWGIYTWNLGTEFNGTKIIHEQTSYFEAPVDMTAGLSPTAPSPTPLSEM